MIRGALGSGQNGRVVGSGRVEILQPEVLEAGRPKARQLIFTRRSDFGPDPTVAVGNHITPYKSLLFSHIVTYYHISFMLGKKYCKTTNLARTYLRLLNHERM